MTIKLQFYCQKCRSCKVFGVKKDLARFLLQGQFFYCGFAIGFCPKSTNVLGQVSTPFFGALKFEFCICENVNKIIVLLSKMRNLQGFRRKKKTLQILLYKVNFSIVVLQSGFAPNHRTINLARLIISKYPVICNRKQENR